VIAAIVPVKALDQAKGRLATMLSQEERRRLSLAMLEDVLSAVQAVPRIDRVTVVSPDPVVLGRVRELGAEALDEPARCRGVNQALTHASNAAADGGADAVAVVAADLPSVLSTEIEAVVDALPDRGIVVVPTDDRGTGAIALRPPGVVPFRFGLKSSVFHKREAVARRLTARVLHLSSLARDVDEPDDLADLLAHPAETATHRLLAELGIAQRLGAGQAG